MNSSIQQQYLDVKRFPITTQEGLSFEDQRLIDSVNLDDLENEILMGRKLNPQQELAMKELSTKRQILTTKQSI